MIPIIIYSISAFFCLISIACLLKYDSMVRENSRYIQPKLPNPPVYQESEIIGKAIELQNAYCNAIYHITERVDITEQEDELLREVNMKQRNFLYHLRKLNPNYQIIKNDL